MGWGEHRERGAEAMLLPPPKPGSLAGRLRARGLGPDGMPLTNIDVDHLLTEHLRACDEIHRLRGENRRLRRTIRQLVSRRVTPSE